ncbi:hypothetical protein BH09BAC5_BH09BAC5_00520 [soil metagenome]
MILCSFMKMDVSNFVPYKTIKDSIFVAGDHILIENVYFQLNKCDLRDSASDSALNNVVDFLKKEKSLKVSVDCHTDYVNPKSSTKLTMCRAKSVTDYFLSAGIDTARLIAKGYGDTKPFQLQKDVLLKSGKTVQKGMILTDKLMTNYRTNLDDYQYLRSLNRRIELTIITTDSLR